MWNVWWMGETRWVDGPAIWRAIEDVAGSAGAKHLAVAYVGRGAFDVVPLGAGDVLVADISAARAKDGSVDPDEIRRFVRAGCRVFRSRSLHAKVVVGPRRAVIGSANLSRSSRHQLLEAGVVTTDAAMVREARAFVQRLCHEDQAVDDAYLDALPRRTRPVASPPRSPELPTWRPDLDAQRVTLLFSEDGGFVDRQIADREATARRSRPGRLNVWTSVGYLRSPVKPGDTVVAVHSSIDGEWAYPPGVVHEVWRHPEGTKAITVVALTGHGVPASAVDDVLRRFGLSPTGASKVVRGAAARAVLALFKTS